jgi:hypothetical protein
MDGNGLCELARLNDLGRLYDVKHALEARGIEAMVWGDWAGGKCYVAGSGKPRLMVRRRDLVYARWIAYSVGIDAWPDEPGLDEASEAPARPALSGKAR